MTSDDESLLVAAALCLSSVARAETRATEVRGACAAERLEEVAGCGNWSAAARAFGDVRAAARALSGYMRSDPLGERLLRVWESARVSQVIEGLARLPKLRRSFEARMSHLQEKIVFELGWRYFCQVVKKELTCGALLQREQAHAWRWRRARRAVRERSQRYRFKDRWRTEAARRKRSELSRREVLLELEEVV